MTMPAPKKTNAEAQATVKIPKGLLWRLKAYAAKRQMRLQAAVETMLEKTLKETGE